MSMEVVSRDTQFPSIVPVSNSKQILQTASPKPEYYSSCRCLSVLNSSLNHITTKSFNTSFPTPQLRTELAAGLKDAKVWQQNWLLVGRGAKV